MSSSELINDRTQKLKEIISLLNGIDEKLLSLANELNWDYKTLLKKPSNMVTCSVNQQHKVPISKLETHEEKCSLRSQGYAEDDKIFPTHSGSGSFVTLTSESLHLITNNQSATVFLYVVFLYIMMQIKTNQSINLRPVPQSSANYDQNFTREEKLAIYDYVIAHTQKQKTYADLWQQPAEKGEEKKREMAPWEIAAAERDAKRRRASYRNKVHTNRKTHTEILREVINAQMEAFNTETISETTKEKTRHRSLERKSSQETRESSDKRKHSDSYSRQNREDRDNRRSRDRHSTHKEYKRSPPDIKSDIESRSRSYDKYRKWKSNEGRSHSHRSSHVLKKH